MSSSIKLDRCVFYGKDCKKKNGLIVNKLKFHAIFDRAAAKAIGAEFTVFDKNAEIRTSYTKVSLDYVIPEVKFHFVIKGFETQALDMIGHQADGFEVKRKGGDGKKKPSKLVVTFNIIYYGEGVDLHAWWVNFSGAEGTLTLTPQQAELPLAEGRPATERREVGKQPKQIEIETAEAAAADSRNRVEQIIQQSQEVKRGPGRPPKTSKAVN